MPAKVHPRAEANRITKILSAVGADNYPLDVRTLVLELAPKFVPEARLEIHFAAMDAVEGALLRSDSGTEWRIIVNETIDHHGRRNFTLAHEFGHFLCHRDLRRSFECSADQIDRFSMHGDDVESEANDFASQLLLPPTIVRSFADSDAVTFERLSELSATTGTSIQAAAIACVAVSSKPIGFVVVKDGFVKWGRASEAAYRRGLFFRSGDEVPPGSRFATEFGSSHLEFEPLKSSCVWCTDEVALETGFYSARYGETCVVIDLAAL